MDKCIYKGCGRQRQNGRYCYKHYHTEQKRKDPVKYAYHLLKSNAGARKKKWEKIHKQSTDRYDVSLSLDEFRKFCYKTRLLVGRGIQKDSYHIDRIDNNKGYSVDNIQVLTNSQNVIKYLHYDWMLDHGRYYTQHLDNDTNEDAPF